jgi:hypothetical protein
MKVVDLSVYRRSAQLSAIERQMSQLYVEDCPGVVKDMKVCFKQWLNTYAEVKHDRENTTI